MDEYTTPQSYLLVSAFHIKRRGTALVQVTPEAAGLLPASVELGQVNFLNHLLEQDHHFLKRVVKPGMGFFSMETAGRTLQGYEVRKRIRKGQVHGVGKGDIKERVTFIASLLAGSA